MAGSLSEYLRQDMECEDLLECFHGLTDLDREVFGVLTDADEPLTVDAVADGVDRERSTVYRSMRRLETAGFVRQDQVNYDEGGYYHVYYPSDPEVVADDMQRMLNDWYAQMGQLIAEFRERYGRRIEKPPGTPPGCGARPGVTRLRPRDPRGNWSTSLRTRPWSSPWTPTPSTPSTRHLRKGRAK